MSKFSVAGRVLYNIQERSTIVDGTREQRVEIWYWYTVMSVLVVVSQQWGLGLIGKGQGGKGGEGDVGAGERLISLEGEEGEVECMLVLGGSLNSGCH